MYGYMRVSTVYEQAKYKNQTFDRQLKILTDYGINTNNIFEDRITGGSETETRKGYNDLMSVIQEGDIIVVSEMSRFSRSLTDLIESVNTLMHRKIGIKFLKENIEIGTDGLSPMNKLLFQLFGAFNEFEKDLIRSRVIEGLASAKARGVKLGRPDTISKETKELVLADYMMGSSYDELQERYKISRPTISRICKPFSKKRKQLEPIESF